MFYDWMVSMWLYYFSLFILFIFLFPVFIFMGMIFNLFFGFIFKLSSK